jgi:hypothetical protein
MKQCPVCKTTYTDDSLRYCLADGATLSDGPLSEETVLQPGVRVDIPHDEATPQRNVPPPRSTGKGFKLFVAVAIILILFAGAAAVAGLILYNNIGKSNSNNSSARVPSPTPVSTPTQSPSTDAEKQRLQDELANLQKKLDQQKNANAAVPLSSPTPDRGHPTAQVNSPNDGFLALRSEPDADYGDRIAKIPHGATVEIENCERSKVTISGRSGRWCQVTYNGQTGYVFDAWLIY